MTDIVERLRVVAWLPSEPELAIEAADEIERLQAWRLGMVDLLCAKNAEIERLRAIEGAARKAADSLADFGYSMDDRVIRAILNLRAALEPKA